MKDDKVTNSSFRYADDRRLQFSTLKVVPKLIRPDYSHQTANIYGTKYAHFVMHFIILSKRISCRSLDNNCSCIRPSCHYYIIARGVINTISRAAREMVTAGCQVSYYIIAVPYNVCNAMIDNYYYYTGQTSDNSFPVSPAMCHIPFSRFKTD